MSNRIFTRKILGLDQRVWLTMGILSILTLGLLSYKLIDKKRCSAFSIKVVSRLNFAGTTHYTGTNIFFEANSSNENVSWTFGDKSRDKRKGLEINHKFMTSGKYYISASINGECETGQFITIEDKPAPSQIKNDTPVTKDIVGPSSTFQGKKEEFFSPALADSFYEWVVLFHPELGTQHEDKAIFRFPNIGKFTIQLTLDHIRIKSYTKEIFVEEQQKKVLKHKEIDEADIEKIIVLKKKEKEKIVQRPPAADSSTVVVTPVEPKIIRIGDKLFKNELQLLVEEKKSEQDFYKYLCSKGSTPVILNSKKDKSRTFSQLCKELKGKRGKSWIVLKGGSITIKSVKLTRDEVNQDCINLVEVEY